MNHQELIKRLQEAFNKEFNYTQAQDVKKLLREQDVSDERCDVVYDRLVKSAKYLPRVKEIHDCLSEMGSSGGGASGGLHPQSPYQQVLRHKSKPVEWIVRECQRIRLKQGREQLMSWEISFIYYWEDLTRLPVTFREVGKQLIIDNDIDSQGRNQRLDELIEEHMERIPFVDAIKMKAM